MTETSGADLEWTFYQPTRIVFGAGLLRELGLEAKRLGVERALVVTDRVLREKTDLVRRAEQALGARLCGVYDGVVADTGVEVVDQGAALARERRADGLVSLGGGSAIDTAKGMAVVLALGGSVRDHQGSQALARKLVPHLAVPTTAGTGSEVSQYAVIKDAAAHEKIHFADDHLVPDLALLDPELTLGLPRLLTAATGLDALTHAIEAYTSNNRNPISDGLALEAIRLIAAALPEATQKAGDRGARARMLAASNLAGTAMSAAGVGLVHAMAHVIGARYGVHHGTANAVCLPHVMRWAQDELGGRYRDVAAAMGVRTEGLSDEAAGAAAADAVARLNAEVGLPAHLREVGVPAGELEACAEQSLSDGAIVYSGKFAAERELVLSVYRAAY